MHVGLVACENVSEGGLYAWSYMCFPKCMRVRVRACVCTWYMYACVYIFPYMCNCVHIFSYIYNSVRACLIVFSLCDRAI